ncbi:MAG: polyprenyl synthetase family protein [Candidatus Micrarchaeaceae archaeon]
MNFKDFIEVHRKEVYETICKYVPVKEPVENHAIMRDYIDRQGSYRRPGLVMLSALMFGASAEDALLPAAAQQLSEDWILMQDDIEDDSELRRGKPAAQKLYGAINAFNASNLGHLSMWRILKDYMLKAGVDKGNRMFEKFYDMLEYTVDGQYLDNNFIHYTKDLNKASDALYYRIVDSKTSYYTVYGPLQIGAIVAGESDEMLQVLKEIGQPAGVAFQIVDDILDMTADEKLFGKKNFGDLYEGKITLIILHTYAQATEEEKEKINGIYRKERKDKTEQEIQFLIDTINKYDGIGYAKEMANKYGNAAKAKIDEYMGKLPKNEYAQVLISAMEELYSRNK